MEGIINVLLIIIAFPLAGAIVLVGEWLIERFAEWIDKRGQG